MNARPHTTPKQAGSKILLKHTGGRRAEKQQLAKLLFNTLQIALTALIQTASGFTCVTDDNGDIDKILGASEKLKALNLEIVTPTRLLANRTVLVRQLDPDYGSKSPEQLLKDITTHKKNHNLGIEKVIKIPGRTKTIKLLCRDIKSAEGLSKNGFFIGWYKVPAAHIHTDSYQNIPTCMRCYKLDDHHTKDCKSEQLCSNCTGKHKHTCCTATNKTQCLNCKRDRVSYTNHHTFALSCPHRKLKVKARLDSTTTKPVIPTKTPLLCTPTPTSNTQVHPQSILRHAHKSVEEAVAKTLTQQLIKQITTTVIHAQVTAHNRNTSYKTILNKELQHQFGFEVDLSDLPAREPEPASSIQTVPMETYTSPSKTKRRRSRTPEAASPPSPPIQPAPMETYTSPSKTKRRRSRTPEAASPLHKRQITTNTLTRKQPSPSPKRSRDNTTPSPPKRTTLYSAALKQPRTLKYNIIEQTPNRAQNLLSRMLGDAPPPPKRTNPYPIRHDTSSDESTTSSRTTASSRLSNQQ